MASNSLFKKIDKSVLQKPKMSSDLDTLSRGNSGPVRSKMAQEEGGEYENRIMFEHLQPGKSNIFIREHGESGPQISTPIVGAGSPSSVVCSNPDSNPVLSKKNSD
mmetsp:Transcript_15326/g.23591  ORF Transcript_15326/g.23591 Transcript_15326/m.23591 type:complete len:106 (-) Transcript_15326:1336-1653(-)